MLNLETYNHLKQISLIMSRLSNYLVSQNKILKKLGRKRKLKDKLKKKVAKKLRKNL